MRTLNRRSDLGKVGSVEPRTKLIDNFGKLVGDIGAGFLELVQCFLSAGQQRED